MTSEIITEALKKAILAKCYKAENGRLKIDIGNSRLDFSQHYYFNGFTNKTVKLSWVNGDYEINVQGKIEKRNDYYSLYTEGWQYIEHLTIEEKESDNSLETVSTPNCQKGDTKMEITENNIKNEKLNTNNKITLSWANMFRNLLYTYADKEDYLNDGVIKEFLEYCNEEERKINERFDGGRL